MRKNRRMVFPSPAEIEFLRIMGGRFIIVSWIVDPKTKFPLTIILDLGKILRRENIEREVRVGAMYIDFATVGLSYNRGIEVDGAAYHEDIVKEQDRDDYLAARGWSVLHIRADEIYRNPGRVQQRVMNFLSS